MAAKKTIKTVLEQTPPSEAIPKIETMEETVTLSDSYAKHGHIVTKYSVIEFINGQATVSKELAESLRIQGFIK